MIEDVAAQAGVNNLFCRHLVECQREGRQHRVRVRQRRHAIFVGDDRGEPRGGVLGVGRGDRCSNGHYDAPSMSPFNVDDKSEMFKSVATVAAPLINVGLNNDT